MTNGDSDRLRASPGTDRPMVTVIMAAFNAAQFVAESCRSVLVQTYPALELVVVDDGSTDETASIVQRLADADPRVRLITQPNAGVAAARNRGISAAAGDFIAPIDADDLWDPTKIERQVLRMRASGPETGLVYCWWAWIDDAGTVIECAPRWKVEGRALDELIEVNFTGSASVPLFRRSCLVESGGYNVHLHETGCGGCEDWELAIRVAERYRLSFVPAVLVGYRRRPGGMSNNRETMRRSHARLIAEIATRRPSVPPPIVEQSSRQFSMYLASVAFWSGQYLQACRWALRARSPRLILAVAPYLARVLARRLLGSADARPTLAADGRSFEEAGLPEPAIPYDRIYQRRWRSRQGDRRSHAINTTP